ncbi:MAG: SDR family oxidoreductase [Roseibium album]|uniref:SDR family oxidoreductase n=1 Tax=Roseibium album TaxID=311410 RepID=UPI0032EF05CC
MSSRIALVLGSTGGIGSAVMRSLDRSEQYDEVIGFSRSTVPDLDLLDEASVEACANRARSISGSVGLVFDATGALTPEGVRPEKSMREIDPANFARSFAINAIGPALLMKHFLPILPKEDRSVFVTLSARVGSITDNRAGGWYAYRAAKAALNQIVRTAAVELARKKPNAICVALHPGTVRTSLTDGFSKTGLEVQEPEAASQSLLSVIDGLSPEQSGQFFDHRGAAIPW